MIAFVDVWIEPQLEAAFQTALSGFVAESGIDAEHAIKVIEFVDIRRGATLRYRRNPV